MKPGSKLGTGLNRLKGGISRLNEVGQEGRVLLLSVDEIEVSEQVRTTFKNIDEMAETLRVEGQQTPIIVGPQNPETNKYPLHKGGRRYAAACLIDGFKLKAIVDATKRESVDYIASQLIENIHRDDLPPYDIAMGLRRMRDVSIENGERLSNVEIAKRIQKSESYVSRYLTLSDLPAEILTLAKRTLRLMPKRSITSTTSTNSTSQSVLSLLPLVWSRAPYLGRPFVMQLSQPKGARPRNQRPNQDVTTRLQLARKQVQKHRLMRLALLHLLRQPPRQALKAQQLRLPRQTFRMRKKNPKRLRQKQRQTYLHFC